MQPPPGGWPPPPPGPPGYPPPPPPGYYPPPQGYGAPQPYYPPPPQGQNGWEGSKTLVTVLVGCLGLVLIVVVGPWVGCAACACIGAATEHPTHTRGHR